MTSVLPESLGKHQVAKFSTWHTRRSAKLVFGRGATYTLVWLVISRDGAAYCVVSTTKHSIVCNERTNWPQV